MKIYKCMHCGNLFLVLDDSGVVPVCCGDNMTALKPNTVDAAVEKHVPVISKDGDKVTVDVGSLTHPMEPEHYIEWVMLVDGDKTQLVALHPADKPQATFTADSDNLVAYAYCNIHGLWVSK